MTTTHTCDPALTSGKLLLLISNSGLNDAQQQVHLWWPGDTWTILGHTPNRGSRIVTAGAAFICSSTGAFLTLLAAVDELSGVDPLSGDEQLGPLLEAVRVAEGHFGQWSTAAGVVDDVLGGFRPPTVSLGSPESMTTSIGCYLKKQLWRYLHDPLDVTVTFSEVDVSEFSSTFPVLDVGFEHGARTFSLSPDHTTHRVLKPAESHSPAGQLAGLAINANG